MFEKPPFVLCGAARHEFGALLNRLEQDYFHLELLPEGICWMRRTCREYGALTEVSRAYYELFDATAPWRRRLGGGGMAPVGFLYDVRGGPVGRSDPAFEDIHKRFRHVMLKHDSALVVLVRSAAGLMQLSRMIREDNDCFSATQDENAALRMLRDHLTWVSEGRGRVGRDSTAARQ